LTQVTISFKSSAGYSIPGICKVMEQDLSIIYKKEIKGTSDSITLDSSKIYRIEFEIAGMGVNFKVAPFIVSNIGGMTYTYYLPV
jgi:hypothetical protein